MRTHRYRQLNLRKNIPHLLLCACTHRVCSQCRENRMCTEKVCWVKLKTIYSRCTYFGHKKKIAQNKIFFAQWLLKITRALLSWIIYTDFSLVVQCAVKGVSRQIYNNCSINCIKMLRNLKKNKFRSDNKSVFIVVNIVNIICSWFSRGKKVYYSSFFNENVCV